MPFDTNASPDIFDRQFVQMTEIMRPCAGIEISSDMYLHISVCIYYHIRGLAYAHMPRS